MECCASWKARPLSQREERHLDQRPFPVSRRGDAGDDGDGDDDDDSSDCDHHDNDGDGDEGCNGHDNLNKETP